MIGLLVWLAGVGVFVYEIVTRHLWPYLLDFALCFGALVWVFVGAGLIAARSRPPLGTTQTGRINATDIERLIQEAKKRESGAHANL